MARAWLGTLPTLPPLRARRKRATYLAEAQWQRADPISRPPSNRHETVAVSPSAAGTLPPLRTRDESDVRRPFRARLASSYRLPCKLIHAKCTGIC